MAVGPSGARCAGTWSQGTGRNWTPAMPLLVSASFSKALRQRSGRAGGWGRGPSVER